MTNAITYFEISGPDAEALRRFYADGLGLAVEPPQDGYAMVAPGEGGVPGGIFDGTEEIGTYAVPYVQVDVLDAAVEKAVAAGATLVVPPRQHGPTRIAHLTDPAGNRVGVYEPSPPPGA